MPACQVQRWSKGQPAKMKMQLLRNAHDDHKDDEGVMGWLVKVKSSYLCVGDDVFSIR